MVRPQAQLRPAVQRSSESTTPSTLNSPDQPLMSTIRTLYQQLTETRASLKESRDEASDGWNEAQIWKDAHSSILNTQLSHPQKEFWLLKQQHDELKARFERVVEEIEEERCEKRGLQRKFREMREEMEEERRGFRGVEVELEEVLEQFEGARKALGVSRDEVVEWKRRYWGVVRERDEFKRVWVELFDERELLREEIDRLRGERDSMPEERDQLQREKN